VYNKSNDSKNQHKLLGNNSDVKNDGDDEEQIIFLI
jgi:hypothetical protein